MRTGLAALLLLVLVLAPGAAGGEAAPRGTWTGTFALPSSSEPVSISVQVSGKRAVVAVGAGHAASSTVAVQGAGPRLRFRLAGRPDPVVFDGVLRGGQIAGTVRQGALRGTFRIRRSQRPGEWGSYGLYRLDDGRFVTIGAGLAPLRAYELEGGELRGLYRRTPGVYDIGAGAGVRQPPAGTLRFAGAGLSWEKQGAAAVRGTRVPVRQVEARVRSGAITLGCTLSLPAGGGPHPAVALVHGSGAVDRSAVGFQTGFYLRHGIAMLACDKRGIGQSGGRYPGELASESTIDVLARDAEAGARFLAAQPEIDRSRIGLSGASQAGWTMPLAASREPAVRFLVLFVAPTVTQGESDHYGQLTGQGATGPEQSPAEIEAEVRRQGPSGVDPVPWIRSLRIPALWLFGSNDQHVPTRLSVERLDPLTKEPGRDFSYAVLPGGNHGLVETEHGLNAEAERSSRFAPGLFPTLGRWLSERRLTGSPG